MDSPTDLVTKFDQIIKSVTDPIITAVDDMIFIVTTVGENGIIGFINGLITSTLDIDGSMRSMRDAAKDFYETACIYTVRIFLSTMEHSLLLHLWVLF